MADRFSKEALTDTLWKLIDLEQARNEDEKVETLREVLALVNDWQNESVHIAVTHKWKFEGNN